MENIKAQSDHLWIVDPIDGTTNFAHGMSLCGVIIAYAQKGKVVIGLIYDPFRNEVCSYVYICMCVIGIHAYVCTLCVYIYVCICMHMSIHIFIWVYKPRTWMLKG